MKIKTLLLKNVCENILSTIDLKLDLTSSAMIKFHSTGSELEVCVNYSGEYYVSKKIEVEEYSNIDLIINADKFLQLISKFTTKFTELTTDGINLIIKANGEYKFPTCQQAEINTIEIDNTIVNFNIENSILQSILTVNSKELLKKQTPAPIQKMYYIDELGCITSGTLGACINNFSLPAPIKLLLTDKIVKLFKLFEEDVVNLSLGFDPVNANLLQTKFKLTDSHTTLVAIISTSNDLVNVFPAKELRAELKKFYPYSVVIDKKEVLDSISRLAVLSDQEYYVPIKFTSSTIEIYNDTEDNKEVINLVHEVPLIAHPYTCVFYANFLINTLKMCPERYLTLLFGNNQRMIIARNSVKNIIVEAQCQ